MKTPILFLCAAGAIFSSLSCFAQGPAPSLAKATFANVIKLNAYVDNWCMVYINGKLAAVDQIEFLPITSFQGTSCPRIP